MTPASHSHTPNSKDWCQPTFNTPNTRPKDFPSLTLTPNPRAALLCSLSNTNKACCFQLFVRIFDTSKPEWSFTAPNQGTADKEEDPWGFRCPGTQQEKINATRNFSSYTKYKQKCIQILQIQLKLHHCHHCRIFSPGYFTSEKHVESSA